MGPHETSPTRLDRSTLVHVRTDVSEEIERAQDSLMVYNDWGKEVILESFDIFFICNINKNFWMY